MQEQIHKLKSVQTTAESKKRMPKIIFILMLLVILLLILTMALLIIRNNEPARKNRDNEATQGLVAGRSPEEIQALLDQIVEEGMFNVSINSQITVGADGRGDVCIENIENNNYLIEVSIIVTDSRGTQVTVYQSGVLDIGYSIEMGTFQIMPPRGYTDAIAEFTALDPKTEQEVGHTNVAVILVREVA